jgi:two-component system, OmpR family, phosphate regulon sensor histidine kinase PhoR
LKSPLTTILGYADFMLTVKADELDPEMLEMVTAIQNSGLNMHQMADDFLAVSRFESGVLTLALTPTELSNILKNVSKDLERAAHEKGLSLVEEIEEGLPAAMMDQRLVQRALANLLQNAIIYTPEGGNVIVKAEKISGGVVVSVTDTGPGIPSGEQARVFEKYYRSPRTSYIKGTGLGLAIVKAAAESHGGRIELESEEGKGCTFRMFIPVQAIQKKA